MNIPKNNSPIWEHPSTDNIQDGIEVDFCVGCPLNFKSEAPIERIISVPAARLGNFVGVARSSTGELSPSFEIPSIRAHNRVLAVEGDVGQAMELIAKCESPLVMEKTSRFGSSQSVCQAVMKVADKRTSRTQVQHARDRLS